MLVFLVWSNDALLGIYSTVQGAVQRAMEEKHAHPGGDWVKWEGAFRWYQRNGPIARLEVEERKVR